MTIAEQLEAATTELAALKAELAKRDEAVAALTETAKQATEQAAVASKSGAEAVATEQAAHQATKAELDQVRKDLDAAKLALANPAHAAAAVTPIAQAVPEGGAEATESVTLEKLQAEYAAISDPVARAKWRSAHLDEIKRLTK